MSNEIVSGNNRIRFDKIMHKNGDEIINGVKTISNLVSDYNGVLNVTKFSIKHPLVIKGTIPNTHCYSQILFLDGTDNPEDNNKQPILNSRLGFVECVQTTTGENKIAIAAYKPSNLPIDGGICAKLQIGYNSDGEIITYAPTPVDTSNTTNIATTAWVRTFCDTTKKYLTAHQSLAAYAPLASPALTGTPTAPTAAASTNNTQIATTAYVKSNLSSYLPLTGGTLTGDLTIGKNSPIISLKNNQVEVNVTAAQIDTRIDYNDKNNHKLSSVLTRTYSDKSCFTYLRNFRFTSTNYNNVWADIGIGYDKDGNIKTQAPTPATTDNSTQIATTAFVKSQGYLTAHQSLSNYVTLNSAQTISGNKTFSGVTIAPTVDYNVYDTKVATAAWVRKYNSLTVNYDSDISNPFCRIAYTDTLTTNYRDISIVLLVDRAYVDGGYGICRVVVRTNGDNSNSTCEVYWMSRDTNCPINCIQAGLYNVNKSTYCDIFYHVGGAYQSAHIYMLAKSDGRYAGSANKYDNGFYFLNTVTNDKYATIAAAGTALHNKAYSTTVTGSDHVPYLLSHQSLSNYSTLANTVKSISISGKTITVTPGSGNAYTLTTQDTVYTHPTTAGNKHIPSGGSSGQFLGWSADGTAKWVNNPNTNTTYTFATGDANGQIKVTPSGGTASNISVKGLGTAAYTASTAYAAASHTHSYLPLSGGDVTGTITSTNAFVIKHTGVVKGTNPSAWTCKDITIRDNSSNTGDVPVLGRIRTAIATNGDVYTQMWAAKFDTGANSATSVTIYNPKSGDPYATCPTPTAVSDNSTKIATTAWVRSATGNTALNAASAKTLSIPASGLTKGTKPSSIYWNTSWIRCDAAGTATANRLCELRSFVDTAGKSGYEMIAYDFKSGSSSSAILGIYKEMGGVAYGTSPTPAAASNDTKIATTAWVHTFCDTTKKYLTSHQSLDSCVKTSGNQSISGTKTFTNNFILENSDPLFYMDSTDIDYAATPSANQYCQIVMRDKNDKSLARILHYRNTGDAHECGFEMQLTGVGETSYSTLISGKRNSSANTVLVGASFGYFRPNSTDTYLGSSSYKWKAVYSANGTIQTSDERKKDLINDIPDDILDIWGTIPFKQFKYKSSIEKKGSSARTHTGMIAQTIKAAFESKGKNPSVYGLFCHDEWNETKEELHDDGSVCTPYQAAGDEYSLRYEEALCMEAAYQRRKNTQLENRITALEEENELLKKRLEILEQAILNK